MNIDKDELLRQAHELPLPEREQLAVSLTESLQKVKPLSKEATAYHEAGHAVIARYFHASVTKLVIERLGREDHWGGEATSAPGNLTPAACVNQFLAGPLAETKFRASHELKTDGRESLEEISLRICFTLDGWTQDFLKSILGVDRGITKPDVVFISPRTQKSFSYPVDWDALGAFIDDAKRARMHMIRDLRARNELVNQQSLHDELVSKLRETCKILDDDCVWRQVMDCARALLGQEERAVLRVYGLPP